MARPRGYTAALTRHRERQEDCTLRVILLADESRQLLRHLSLASPVDVEIARAIDRRQARMAEVCRALNGSWSECDGCEMRRAA